MNHSRWVEGEVVRFALSSLPPSKNELHTIIRQVNQPLKFQRSTKYNNWLNECLPMIKQLKPSVDSAFFKVRVVFNYPFYHQNGKLKRQDSHNFLEALCDAIATKNGFDDSYIKVVHAEAYHSDKVLIECEVTQIKESHVLP